jgi:hypothetical protein
MVFYYKSTSTDYNNSGTIAVSVNYNATEYKYSSIEQVLNSMFAVASKPSESFAAPVECDPEGMPDGGYYVRHESAVQTTTDLRMSTVGTVQFVTEGLTLPAGTVVGQLWCTYDVELLFPYITPDNVFTPSTWYAESNFMNVNNSLGDFLYESTRFPFNFSTYGTGYSKNIDILVSDRTEPGNYQIDVTVIWTEAPDTLGTYHGIDQQTGAFPGKFVTGQSGDMTFLTGADTNGSLIVSSPTNPDHYDWAKRTLTFEVREGASAGSITNLIGSSQSRIASGSATYILGYVTYLLRKI